MLGKQKRLALKALLHYEMLRATCLAMFWRYCGGTTCTRQFHSITYPATAKIITRQVARKVGLRLLQHVSQQFFPLQFIATFHNVTAPLRRCYTRQFLLQLVSQFCCDTSCALRYRLLESYCTRQRFSVILSWNKTSRAQKEQFDWPMPLNVATQVAGKVLHCATWEKFLATLQNALRKVELTSTFRNDCGNKKIATDVCSRVCYTRQYFVQLVSQQNCETSCERNCLV